MLVSLHKGNPIYTPIYYNPYEYPQKGTSNFVKLPYKLQHKEGRRRITTWDAEAKTPMPNPRRQPESGKTFRVQGLGFRVLSYYQLLSDDLSY